MQEVYNQLFCLLIFIITGIVIGILFDIFRILRRSFKTADWITYLQDILFWILAGCIMLFSIFTFNNGEIRSYVFIGIILGVIIYILTISKYFIKYSVTIIQFFKKILSYPIHLIEMIVKKIIIEPIAKLVKNGRNVFNTSYEKMKNTTKSKKATENNTSKKKNNKTHNFTKFNHKSDNKCKKIKEKEGILQKM